MPVVGDTDWPPAGDGSPAPSAHKSGAADRDTADEAEAEKEQADEAELQQQQVEEREPATEEREPVTEGAEKAEAEEAGAEGAGAKEAEAEKDQTEEAKVHQEEVKQKEAVPEPSAKEVTMDDEAEAEATEVEGIQDVGALQEGSEGSEATGDAEDHNGQELQRSQDRKPINAIGYITWNAFRKLGMKCLMMWRRAMLIGFDMIVNYWMMMEMMSHFDLRVVVCNDERVRNQQQHEGRALRPKPAPRTRPLSTGGKAEDVPRARGIRACPAAIALGGACRSMCIPGSEQSSNSDLGCAAPAAAGRMIWSCQMRRRCARAGRSAQATFRSCCCPTAQRAGHFPAAAKAGKTQRRPLGFDTSP